MYYSPGERVSQRHTLDRDGGYDLWLDGHPADNIHRHDLW